MNQISNETLMAFADGELANLEADVVRAAVENDPGLRERLEGMQRVDELLRMAFPAPVDMPDRFEQLLRVPAPTSVVRLVTKSAGRRWLPAGAAIAAGFIGLVIGNVFSTNQPGLIDLTNGVQVAGMVQTALSQRASGEVAYEHGVRIEPVLSFIANDGRSCRDVKIDARGAAARMIACRNVNGSSWQVEALARVPANELHAYRPAGERKDVVIDAAVARLGIKATLDASEERTAIERDWRAN
jgi:anti-sigma factor RsiW